MTRPLSLIASLFASRSAAKGKKAAAPTRRATKFLREAVLHLLEERVLLTDITISTPADLAQYFTSANNTYTIDAGKDTVTISSGITLATANSSGVAGGIVITGGTINIGANVSMITDAGGSNQSGNISISGKNIGIGSNVLISANGTTNSLDGTISIAAENEKKLTFGVNAWMQVEDLIQLFQDQSATIDVGANSQIVGGAISVQAASGNPLKWENWTTLSGSLISVIGALSGHPNPFSIPVAIQSWSPKSEITFATNSQVVSSSKIIVNATAESNAIGKASWFESLNLGFGFAAGLFFTDATANVVLSQGANLTAAGAIAVTSNVTNTIELQALSDQNRGISPTSPNAVNISFGLGSLTTNSVIDVQAGASVVSQSGTINLTALATDTNKVKVKGKTYRDGLATISSGTVLTEANVQVIVNGTVNSGYSMMDAEAQPLVFNPATTVDFANSQFIFDSNVPYKTGQELIFDSGDGGSIPGLVSGEYYYAIVDSVNPKILQLATTKANADNGVNIEFGLAYPTLNFGNFTLPITLIDNAYTNSILFSYDTVNGSPILPGGADTTATYTPAPGRFIGYNDANGNLIGALPAGTYTISKMNWPAGSMEAVMYPLAIQLIDSQGQTIYLNPNSYFTSNGTNYQMASFDTESSQINFNFEQPSSDNPSGMQPLPVPNQQVNLANGAELIFTAGLNNPIENLVSGQSYWAIVDQNQPGVIQLATSLAQSQAANPAVQDALPRLITTSNQACIASVSGTLLDSKGQATSSTLSAPTNNNAYTLYNSAVSGTFQLTVNGPEGVLTTAALAYNASAEQVQLALNSLAGIQATVTGAGTSTIPWNIGILFNFEVGNFQNSTELTFSNNPNIAAGTEVVFQAVEGKPVPGLVSGTLAAGPYYYAFNQANPDFISEFPQYILTLKGSNSATSPDISVNLNQSMTDASGNSYDIGSQDPDAGLISLLLPEVSTPVSVNGSLLTGGTVSGNMLTNPALVLYSVADAGSFTLTLTDAAGTSQTTTPIAWNATASAVQSALNALTGITTIVVGNGTLNSPWTISGIAPGTTVTDDTTNLLYDGKETDLVNDIFFANTQQVWLSGATGGTFTVTLSYGSNQLVTVALPFNATTQQFADAINTQGFQAQVTGSGTATDPWQFMAYYNPIKTGQALTFNDAWNQNSLGMINGLIYYAVTSDTQYNAGEVMLSLASTAANATASPPVLLNMQSYLQIADNLSGSMTSSQMGLAAVPSTSGVTISAKLKSKDAVTDMAKTGGYPPLKGFINKLKGGDPYDVYGLNKDADKVKRDLIDSVSEAGGYEKSSQKTKNSWKKIHKDYGGDPTNPIEASLGLAVLTLNNTCQVIIGSQSRIFSAGNVKLGSIITEQYHAQADAGVARTTKSASEKGNLATALGLAVSVLDNTSQVIVQPNAQINAAGKVAISSNISYPFAWKATTISLLKNYGSSLNKDQKAWAGIGIASAILTQALTGSGAGMGNWLFNSSSNSYTIQSDHKTHDLLGTALGGSVNIVDITNNNLAQICDGAQINQNFNFSNLTSLGVSLSAVTTMDQVSAAGQMKFFLNLAGIATLHPLDASKSNNVLGGSVNVVSMDNSTQALIGGDAPQNGNSTAIAANGPTRINYGQYGLSANALTDIMYVSLSQSGGSATGFGLEASVAVTEITSQNTTAAILSASCSPVIRNAANSTGNIAITASDDTTLTPSAGGLLVGKAINIGFSSAEAILNRNVSAFIGNANPTDSVPAGSWPVIQSGGNIAIQSSATGKIVPASIAGSVISKSTDAHGQEVPDDHDSHFGAGVSGDYSEAKVVDNVVAGINGGNLTGVSNQKAIGILAINETRLNLSTGAASFQFERGRDSALGFAGAASYSNYTSNVWAGVSNANVKAFEIGISARNNKTIGTFAAGLAGGSVAGVGIEVAGSVAINHVTNDTVAEIANTTGTNLGSVELMAVETDDIWAAAGTVTFVVSWGSAEELDEGKAKTKVGFGFGFAQNLLDSTTHAIISDSNLTQADGSLSLEAEQASRSFVLSAGLVFEAGKGTGITPYGMVALNQYTSADVQAVVENSKITSSSTDDTAGFVIASQLIPIMITAAGDLGLSIAYKTGAGAEASIGAGVSVTEVSITGNSVASVSNSTISLDQGDLEVKAYTGQVANATNLNNTLTNLNLPPGNYNLYSLAIAGGLTTAIAPAGELALGVDGVGAGIGSSTSINTLANVTNGSNITLYGKDNSNGSLSVEALENLSIYDDAGGASVSIQTSLDTSIGIAVGIGAGVHNSTNSAVASVSGSDVTAAGSMTVSATSTSNVTVIGFGVALDVSIAEAAGMALGISASSATGKITSDNTISAYITGGDVTVDGAVDVNAIDNSEFRTGVGSGSLSVSYGTLGGAALAAGASVSRIEPSHMVSAYIGSMDANSTTQSNVTACGPIEVQATNNQQISAQTIAVASSVAIGGAGSLGLAGAGAGARITTNNNITAGVLYGSKVTSQAGSGQSAVAVEAVDSANLVSTVGSAALSVSITPDPYAMIGFSLGISISEITNNDYLSAIVKGASITTQGGDVVVQALGNNNHFSESVATSATDGLGLAGAGGNSNIYDNSNITASVDSGASIVTGNATTGYGRLSVLANTSENVEAQMFGGSVDLGIGSIGVFMSNATRSGSTVANLVTNGTISVGNLAVKATTNQTVTSEGMSVTVGLLAGTGETHRLYIDESIQTTVNGSGKTWNVYGNLSIGASSTNNATAQTSGAGDNQQDVSVAGLGVGFFKVISAVNPNVSTSVSDVALEVSGSSSMGTIATSENHATAQSGSGSLVGGDAARAITDNSPTISFNTSNLILTSASATFLARNCGTYTTNADSVYATAVGGSAARAYNTSNPNLTLNLGSNTAISANGSVIVKAENDVTGLGDATNMSGNTGGIMARVGGGGFVSGFGGTSESCLTACSAISLANGVSILAKARGGKILIGSSQGWNTNQLTYIHDFNYFAGGANVKSSLNSCLTNNISVGSNVNLTSPGGMVGIGTSINTQTTADSYSQTFSTIGGSQSESDNIQSSCQTVSIGSDSLLRAAGDISVTTGFNPVTNIGSLQDTYALVTAHNKGALSIPGTSASATSDSKMNVSLASGSQLVSNRDVNLGALPGINNAQWYTFANMDGAKGKTHSGTDGVNQTSCVTIYGNIIAGYTHQLAINIPQSGDSANVNGQAVSLPGSTGLTIINPQPNSAFLPFQAGYNPNYNATQLLTGLDPTSKAILEKSISSTPVKAITLANLAATGGQVVIHANTSLVGTGTVSAFSPNITVNNNSPAYLILDGIGIPNTLNMGKITVVGSAGASPGLTLNQQLAKPSITINENFKGVVGTGTTSGPAIAITSPIVNTGGTVSLFNANGALVQDAPINAAAVSVSTPNSAYIVNTPNNYKGIGGSIADYWMNSSQNLVQNSSFENPACGTGNFVYNPVGANWTFNVFSGVSGNDSGFTLGNPNAPAGSQVGILQKTGVISQTITGLIAGQSYNVSFYAAQRAGYFSSSTYQELTVTLGSTILVSSLKPSSTNYQQYSYTFTPSSSGNQTLTFTGLEPTGQDETVFLDQVMVTPTTTNFTPGLNSYVYQYTANLAATTAANILYLEQSGATNSTAFSNWLYNTQNLGVGGVDFVNTNVSAGNPGSYYPSKASNNWGTTENGTGVIFFGSEIPYLWVNSGATIPTGSSYLTSGLGYLDTLANAQYWSMAASGNPADSYLNVTQGTGPQNDNVNPGRGIYPVVPSTFPTYASINNPQNATLGNGITAGQLDITALYIDINAPINLGVNNAGFQANLTASLGSYIQSQVAGNASLACVPIPASYLGGANTSLTAYYDVQANQIVLSPVDINAGVVSAIFKGGIISTTNQGKISVTSNAGENQIQNQSGYSLVIQGISAAESKLAGIVQFNDTLTNLSTAYVYRGNSQVDKYQGPLGPLQGANLSQLKLVGSSTGTSATFSPAPNLAYEWYQQAYISKNLGFSNNNNAYTLYGSNVVASGTVNDSWAWGPLVGGSASANYTSATNPLKVTSVPVNLVKSGGFETPEITTVAPGNYQYNPSGSDWTFTALTNTSALLAGSGLAGNRSSFTYLNPSSPQGTQVAFLQGKGKISQTISGLVAGTSYTLTFLAAQRSGYFSSSTYQTFNISLGSQLIDSNVKPESTGYNQFSYTFTCNTTGSLTLTFTGLEPTGQDETVFLDAVVLTVNQPDSSSAQGSIVNLASPISNYTEQLSALITESETATTYFSSTYTDAWNFGPSTQWTWMYPTEILMTIKNQLPACNPITIDFSGVQFGSLGITSGSSLVIDGNIQFPGTVSLSSGGNISQTSGAVIIASQLTGLTATGAIGNATSPLNLSIGSGSISAQAGTGVYLSSSQSLNIANIAAADGPVQIQSGGNIAACGTSTNVSGSNINLLASNGSIGSQAQPIAIQTKTTPLPTGSVTGGLFTATANNAIFVTQATGDLRISSVSTTSPVGVVSINNAQGNITDGNIPDAFGLNNSSLSPALVGHVIDSMRLNSQNNVNTTIAAFEGSVDSSYLQYWTALQNGSVANGSLTLTANGVLYYQNSANLYYANTANQTSNATKAQVNSYANMLYDNSINVFENNLAYGPGWASLPQFQVCNPNYTFTASNATISALSYRAINIGNDFALISLDALTPKGSSLLGNSTAPAIQTAVLDLKAGGSIGLTLAPVEIGLDSIQSGNLTAQEKAVLALATTAGELQMVGTNPAGEKVYYSYGSKPANVTETSVVVRIEKPLFVDVADNGLTLLQANDSINLSGTEGSLNVLGASSLRDIRLTSQGAITQGQLQASTTTPGWSLAANGTLGYSGNGWTWSGSCLTMSLNSLSNVTASRDLRLISGGDIGTPATPIVIQVGNALSVYASGSLALNQPTGNLLLSDIQAGPQGAVQISAGGSISNANPAKYITKSILSGFGGWIQSNQTTAPSQVPANLQLTDGMNNCATAWWYQQQVAIPTTGCITVQFDYQAAGNKQADGITLALQTVGTSALGGVGGSLGYNGISGPVAAYQINLYNAGGSHVPGSNFVTSNATGSYLPTGNVNFTSGDTISVTLVYDADLNTITENLKDLSSGKTYQRVYSNINLASVIGTLGYIGFTGADGGATSIQTVSNFTLNSATPISLKGSLAGFGGNGTGWATNSNANGASSISNNVLTLNQSQPPSGGISSASAMLSKPLTIDNSFISSFVYQSQTAGSTTYFVIKTAEEPGVVANLTGVNPGSEIIVGLQISTPSASPLLQTVGLLYNGVLQDMQVPDGINFASGDAIHVVITYNNSQKSITVALADTVTLQTYSFVSNNIDMLKVLGSTQGQIGFFSMGNGQPATQTISGFSFAYGSPTIQGQSLTITAGGEIGSAADPILTLVSGNISATAPSGVYLLQTDGNMYVQSVTSTGNVSLAAPAGSVVGSSGGTVQSSGGIRAAAKPRATGVVADQLTMQSLVAIGSQDQPLMIRATGLSASTLLSDIRLNQIGSLEVSGPVSAGGAIQINGDSGVNVLSSVIASGPVSIETLPGMVGRSRVSIASGGSVVSTGDRVSILGGEGVTVSAGGSVESHGSRDRSQILLASIAHLLTNFQTFDVEVRGSLLADNIEMQAQASGSRHYLDLGSVAGLTQRPTVQIMGAVANNTLNINDSAYGLGRSVLLDSSNITTPQQFLSLSAIDQVIMTLGSGPDTVEIGKNTGLRMVTINTGPGSDTVKTVLSAASTARQQIIGGTEADKLLISADIQPTWSQPGQISTATGTIQYEAIEKVVVSDTPVMNGLPVAFRFVGSAGASLGQVNNRSYVNMIYQQVLNRDATPTELAQGTRQLDRRILSREQFARRVLNSVESLNLQVNAWYMAYLDRQSSPQELARSVSALRRGQPAHAVLGRLLAGQEFYDRTQQIAATGSAADRYITGLYNLAISPASSPDAGLMLFLQKTLQKQGRLAVANQVLKSAPMAVNLAQAISLKVNHQPADSTLRTGLTGPNGLTARLLSRPVPKSR